MANQILTNSFDLVVLCKGNRNTNDILLKSNKIHKKLLRYQSFIKKHSNNLERFNRSSGINSTALSAIKEQSDEIFENMGPGFDDISGIGNNSLGNKSFGMENETTHLLDINNFQISFRDIFIKKENQNFFNIDNDLKYASIIREIRYRIFKRNDYQMRQLTLYSIFYYDLIYRFNLLKTVLYNFIMALGYSNGRATSNRMILVSLVFYLFFIFEYVYIVRKQINEEIACLAEVTMAGIMINSVVVGLLIFAQPRYMVYFMGLFYFVIVLMTGYIFRYLKIHKAD